MILSRETRRPERIRSWSHGWVLAVATVCLGAFMGQLDASIVTLTYGPLQARFEAGPAAVQWVSLSYLLSLVALLAPVGRRSDQTGRKLAYVRGFVVFGAASAVCGLAPSLPVLVGARVAQGVGAALIQANSVALVTDAAPAGRLRQALGFQAAAQALGLALGPTVGGVVVSTVGWRWVFALNVPVSLIAAGAGLLFLPRTRRRAPASRPDLTGSALLGGSAVAVLLVLSALAGLPLPAPATVTLAAGGAIGILALARHLRTAPDPVVSREVVGAPGVALNLAAAAAGYLVLFGPLVLVPAVLGAQGVSALRIGLVLSALPMGFALAATTSAVVLPRRWSERTRARAGMATAAACLGWALAGHSDQGWMAATLAGVGLGLGVLAPSNNASVMRAVPATATASAGGLLNMTRSFGTALGVSLVTLALNTSGPRLAIAVLLSAALVGAAALAVPGPRRPYDAL